MLDVMEASITQRLAALKASVPRLVLKSYGGELSDPDMLAEAVSAGHAVLVTAPKARFTRKSNRRYSVTVSLRLVIAVRQARDEQATRHGMKGSLGSYALWDKSVRLLAGFDPLPGFGRLEPTDFNNLVNGKTQRDYLSVLGQSFDVDGSWEIPTLLDGPPIEGIDLNYYLQPDDNAVDAVDRITPT